MHDPLHFRSRLRPLRAAAALLGTLLLAGSASGAAPSAGEIMEQLGFPKDARDEVLAGKFVRAAVPSSGDTEIALGMAFLVRVAPDQFVEDLVQGVLMQVDPNAIEDQVIEGPGRLDDFAAFDLGEQPEERAEVYREAEPGSALNLSSEEIAAFGALGEDASTEAVAMQLRRQLLERYQAYRAGGLSGIAPYARGGDQTDPGAILKQATESAKGLEGWNPSFYRAILDYPDSRPKGLRETFRWTSYEAHGEPVVLLTHGLMLAGDGAHFAMQRQFYVSATYNVEQALVGFLPVEEGTVVVYVNRTSTDQVSGFGGSAKRSIGAKVMASQLQELFEKLRAHEAAQ